MVAIPTSHCEAILRGMSKRADKDGDWIQVVWQIHPAEVPQALWNADLRSRWQLAFVEIGDDEQPKGAQASCKPLEQKAETSKHRPPATTRAEKARRLCGVVEFQKWMGCESYEATSLAVKQWCSVKSKNEFDMGGEAASLWDSLLWSFESGTGRMAEKH